MQNLRAAAAGIFNITLHFIYSVSTSAAGVALCAGGAQQMTCADADMMCLPGCRYGARVARV